MFFAYIRCINISIELSQHQLRDLTELPKPLVASLEKIRKEERRATWIITFLHSPHTRSRRINKSLVLLAVVLVTGLAENDGPK